MSAFEQLVARLLKQAGIPFQQEKIFKDCYNGHYKFDFYLPSKNSVLELNGMQHYKYTEFFHKKKTDFTKAQERDRRKISYCLANNITLYIIPYWEMDNLKNIKDIFQDKFIAHSKFHNDNVWEQQKSKIK